ncbi:MAG: type II secretion system minor pseudopilin GspK [Rhodobacteraceae bacterium]|nr:type II secretion system minor pseudopilin GspK [Paracoccaceae bacterium]
MRQVCRPPPKSIRGLVLINALLVVAALSAVAVLLLQTAETARNRQHYVQEVAQTQAYLDGFELLLRGLLDADRARGNVDHSKEPWAQKNYTVEIDRGHISGTLRDLQGRFNLNWLAGGDSSFGPEAFKALMQGIGQRSSLANAIMDWVSEDGPQNLTPYLTRSPGLAPVGGNIELLDELRLVKGMTPAIFTRLETVLTAVPSEGVVNINTAPRAVLQALMPKVSSGVIGALVAERDGEPFETDEAVYIYLQGVLSEEELEKIPSGVFVTSSHWFEAEISATLGQTQLWRRVIFRRSGESGKTRVEYRLTPKAEAR